MKVLKISFLLLLVSFFWKACGGSGADNPENAAAIPQSMLQKEETGLTNKGIGPVKEVIFAEKIDMALAAKGEEAYKRKGCVACHKPNEEFLGPAPKGVLERRSPEWVMNLILNSEEMRKKDPDAKKLTEEYRNVFMIYQNLTQEEARAILEYFRTL